MLLSLYNSIFDQTIWDFPQLHIATVSFRSNWVDKLKNFKGKYN